MAVSTVSTLLTISLLVEEDADTADRVSIPLRSEEEIRKAVLLSVALLMNDGGRPDVRVEWESLTSMVLDEAEGFGRCAVCNRWAFDAELDDGIKRRGVSRGAVVDGHLRCDEHLPSGHPLCFAGRGYDRDAPDSERKA